MNSQFFAKRRRVLMQIAAALGAAVVNWPTNAAPKSSCIDADRELSAAIDELISQRNSAAIIGEAYLSQFDEERSVDRLMSQIRKSLSADANRVDAQSLLGRIRADFECGDIVNLQGWLLARTEARLCALCTF